MHTTGTHGSPVYSFSLFPCELVCCMGLVFPCLHYGYFFLLASHMSQHCVSSCERQLINEFHSCQCKTAYWMVYNVPTSSIVQSGIVLWSAQLRRCVVLYMVTKVSEGTFASILTVLKMEVTYSSETHCPDRGSKYSWNFRQFLSYYTVQHPRRQSSLW
jgi:hypothetical protein